MKRQFFSSLRLIIFLFLITGTTATQASNDGLEPGTNVKITEMDQLKYTILYIGSDSKTHFKDDYLTWQRISDSVTNPRYVTPFQRATDIGFLRIPIGQISDWHPTWHPTPRKQFLMVLKGIIEMETEDGQKRTFTPGSVLLLMDVSGKGHRTNVLGDQDVLIAWVPVP